MGTSIDWKHILKKKMDEKGYKGSMFLDTRKIRLETSENPKERDVCYTLIQAFEKDSTVLPVKIVPPRNHGSSSNFMWSSRAFVAQ